MGLAPALSLLRAAIEHRHLVPRLGQMPGHREPHNAQAHECDLHAQALLNKLNAILTSLTAPCRGISVNRI